MALSFTTGMTLIDSADAVGTNWAAYKITAGGSTPTATADATVKKQGSACIGITPTASKDCGIVFNAYAAAFGGKGANTVVNLSTAGNEVLALWILGLSPAVLETLANGGMYVIIECDNALPSATGKWAKWYVSGSNVTSGGWTLFLVDTRKTPTATNGGWASGDLANVYRIGAGTMATATAFRTDSFFVDAMWFGRPTYTVKGDGSTTATWADFLSDATTNANGLIQDAGGAYIVSCGLRIGDDAQTATTTFADSTNPVIIFKRHTYYYSGSTADALNYSDYYILEGKGAASYRTSITLGQVVGTGDNRQGLGGGFFKRSTTSGVQWKIDFATDKAHLSAVRLYGLTIRGAVLGASFDNDSGGTETTICSCSFTNCGEINVGTTGNGAEMLNTNIADPLDSGAGTNRGLLLPTTTTHRVSRCNFITSGTPSTQHLIRIDGSGTQSVKFADLQFFGTYSGTVYQFELSNASLQTITLNLGGANVGVDTSKTHKSGNGSSTITTATSVTLRFEVVNEAGTGIDGAFCYIDDNDQAPYILNTTTAGGGIASIPYSGSAVTGARWRVRKYGYKQWKAIKDIGASNITMPVTLVADPQQV